jgi:hypothetical protein
MANCKQPLTLTEISMRRERETLNNVLADWIRMLLLAGNYGIWNYSQQVEEVTNKCKTLNEHLTSLPTSILDDLIRPLIADFLNKISSYHKTFLGLKRIRKHAETKHEVVCTEMLNCLLGPFTKLYDTGIMSSFEQRLVIQTFPSTPKLTVLVFGTAPEIDNSALLAINIRHLKHLVSFQYNYRCTDRVVQQLALHCSKMRKIDVSNSRAVTDGSVQHLLTLKDLSHLDLTGTSVTARGYRLLLSGLPNITNISYSSPICDSLNSM